jgi:hypothetical protein
MRHTKRILNDKNQPEFFGIVWLTSETHPHRLRAGDVIRYAGKLARIVRVNDCAAVVVMNRPARQFETRFRGSVKFQPSPALFRISPQSECEILNPTRK